MVGSTPEGLGGLAFSQGELGVSLCHSESCMQDFVP